MLARVVASWPQILEKIKDYNHSLLSSLKLAAPAAVQGSHLVVAFPYKFHQDAIDARKNRIVVDQVLEEVLGVKLLIKSVLTKDWTGPLPTMDGVRMDQEIDLAAEPAPQDAAVDSALKIMGGELDAKKP
jgi:hypothetical protein